VQQRLERRIVRGKGATSRRGEKGKVVGISPRGVICWGLKEKRGGKNLPRNQNGISGKGKGRAYIPYGKGETKGERSTKKWERRNREWRGEVKRKKD